MSNSKPTSLSIHVYNVGFGDCFLLSFHYSNDPKDDCNMMIDFGTKAAPANIKPAALYDRIAADIQSVTGGKLNAVVLSHRHQDHIEGFGRPVAGKIIRDLKPDIVVQPWTEDPKAKTNAPGPKSSGDNHLAFTERLANMQLLSEGIAKEARHLLDTDPHPGPQRALFAALEFIGEEGIKNPSAVKNLMEMGDEHAYVYAGAKSGLEKFFPGVKVTVLGPPTIAQHEEVKTERSRDADEFWMLQGLTGRHLISEARDLFPKAEKKDLKATPEYARWIIPRLRRLRAENLLQIVRIMDDALNNTSVILLFEVNDTTLLFPGDAQIENWEYTLSKTDLMKRLANVNVYKVGHHGSRNATPRSLWNAFLNKGPAGPKRLRTIVSTKADKYGSLTEHSEVPRRTLVTALKANSDYFSTQTIKGKQIKKVIEVDF